MHWLQRRRMQIRLAQRAYRNRKEDTMQRLTKEVQDLKHVNDKMIGQFTKIYKAAIDRDIPKHSPAFAAQLRFARYRVIELGQSCNGISANGEEESRSQNLEHLMAAPEYV
jgi:hypothetical protein